MRYYQNIANRPKIEAAREKKEIPFMQELSNFKFSEKVTNKLSRYFIFMGIFGVIYIANTHFAERTIRKINRLQSEVDELRTGYSTMKAQYIIAGKRSEILKQTPSHIKESDKPAFKVVVKKN